MVSITRDFFLFCSGANKEILEKPECAIDYPKFVSLGMAVFLSAIFAFLSGSYAVYLSSQSSVLSVLLGAVWGLIIFGLDRFIVSTLKRKIIPPNLSLIERLRLRSNEILGVLPRILLAVIISPLMVFPLELKLLQKELDVRVAAQRADEVLGARRRVREQFSDIARLENENDQLREAIATKRKQTTDLLESLIDNPASIADLITDQRTHEFLKGRSQLQELKKLNEGIIAANTRQLEYLNAQANAKEEEVVSLITTTRSDGLIIRMKAMNALKAENKSVATFGILMLLLFIILETTPVLVKLLSNVGPYEYFWGVFESMATSDMQSRRTSSQNKSAETVVANQIIQQSQTDQSPILEMTELKSDVPLRAFLCHSKDDKPAIRSLYKRLKKDDIDAWLDEEEILPGQFWETEIVSAMRSCDVVIACLSNKSVNKEGYVQKEIRHAIEVAAEKPEGSIFLIPAKLDECNLPNSMSHIQWVNLFAENGYDRLMSALHKRANEN